MTPDGGGGGGFGAPSDGGGASRSEQPPPAFPEVLEPKAPTFSQQPPGVVPGPAAPGPQPAAQPQPQPTYVRSSRGPSWVRRWWPQIQIVIGVVIMLSSAGSKASNAAGNLLFGLIFIAIGGFALRHRMRRRMHRR